MKFSPLDLVVPWAVCLIASGLCVAGAFAAPEVPAKVVSALTGCVFLSGIAIWYVIRGKSWKVAFTCSNGLKVSISHLNRPTKYDVERLLTFTTKFWVAHYPEKVIDNCFKDKWAIFIDEKKYSLYDRWVKGYSTENSVVVTYDENTDVVARVFKHECSHQILTACGMPWDEKKQHEEMSSVGFA